MKYTYCVFYENPSFLFDLCYPKEAAFLYREAGEVKILVGRRGLDKIKQMKKKKKKKKKLKSWGYRVSNRGTLGPGKNELIAPDLTATRA